MISNINSQNSLYIKRIPLEKCVKDNHKISLFFTEDIFKDLSPSKVIIKNTKNREEFSCQFTQTIPNMIIIDLDKLWFYFTDYEGSITISTKVGHTSISLIPILSTKNIIELEEDPIKSGFRWFIRTLDNGELRLSSIINKRL